MKIRYFVEIFNENTLFFIHLLKFYMISHNSESLEIKTISSLKELVEALPHCSGNEFVQIAQGIKLDPADFEPYAFWSANNYTRNCIARSPNYELILLCWDQGVETPIHCHGGEECWVYGVTGTLEETRFDFNHNQTDLKAGKVESIEATSLSYMNDNMGYHKIANLGESKAMTLHLYMNPIDKCNLWQPEEKRFEYTEMAYDTFKGEVQAGSDKKLAR
jgi:cysteine dioxygenase